MEEQKSVSVSYLDALARRAKNAENPTSRAYLACLCGMWTESLGQTVDPVTPKDGEDLVEWYTVGIKASSQAAGMGVALTALEEKKKEKEKKKGLKSFFHLK